MLGLGSPHAKSRAVQSDYYRRLGIQSDSDDEEVHKAYRRLARQTHPDAEGGEKNKFLAVHEAYEVLADPVRRRQYDASREHAMHLEWSENARPAKGGSAGQNLPEDPRVLKNVYFIAGVVVLLVLVAFLVDAIV
ncbi:MAG: J domain-containing protein [Candidatus Aegiribacteria sp.]